MQVKMGFHYNQQMKNLTCILLKKKIIQKKAFIKQWYFNKPEVQGFYMFINGGENDNQLWYGFRKPGFKYSKEYMQNCKLAAGLSQDKIYLYLQSSEGQIHVSYHMGADDSGYKECGIVYIPPNDLFNFYPIMYAKSVKNSKFGIKVTQMTLETQIPNPSIQLFENQQNEEAPKLFKEISFIKNNKHQVQVSGTDINETGVLDLYKVYQLQNKVYRIVDYSNEKLAQCLSQTDSFYDFAQLQKKNYMQLGKNVVQTINTWVGQSHKQFEDMNKDIKELKESLRKYEIGTILDKTQKVMEVLSGKIFSKQSVLVDYKKFAKAIQQNIKKLNKNKKKQNSSQNKNLITFLGAQLQSNMNSMQSVLSIGMTVMGLLVLIVLIVVYVRLGGTNKEIL